MSRLLEQKIRNKTAKISVIGLGYVGLPLAVGFANAGFKVTGIDTDQDRVSRVLKSNSYVTDIPSSVLRKARKEKGLEASTDFRVIKESDIVLICVPTPMKSRYTPDISFIIDAVMRIKKLLVGTKLIILESTTYPGTTDEIVLRKLESGGLKCGKDFYLVFSPERIDPGNKTYSLDNIPKVIGGITKDSSKLAQLLYKNIIFKTVVVSSSRVAETVKLLENTFRIVNIGLINEMAMMCHKLNINIWEVIEAAKTKPFGFMPFYPGPGVGGHCIPKDPLYLYWKALRFGFSSRFIKLASELNSYMPQYIIERLKEALQERKKNLTKSKILIVGVTYKKDVKDLRKSPALDIIKLLQQKGIRVSYYDPLIPYLKIHGIDMESIVLSRSQLKQFACAVIVTDHSKIDYNFIRKNSALVFDTRCHYGIAQREKVITL